MCLVLSQHVHVYACIHKQCATPPSQLRHVFFLHTPYVIILRNASTLIHKMPGVPEELDVFHLPHGQMKKIVRSIEDEVSSHRV